MSVADGRYDLLETMAFDPHEGVRLLELHLGRLKDSAQALGFAFDRHSVRNELQAATFRLRELSRVRLLVSRQGSVSIEVASPFAAAARSPPKSKPAKPQPAGSGFVDFGALGGGQQDI